MKRPGHKVHTLPNSSSRHSLLALTLFVVFLFDNKCSVIVLADLAFPAIVGKVFEERGIFDREIDTCLVRDTKIGDDNSSNSTNSRDNKSPPVARKSGSASK